MINKKEKTIDSYSLMAQNLGDGYDKYFKEVVQPEADKFLLNIPKNGVILDVGCGVGTHSLYFKEKRYNVVSVDLSPTMIDICKNKGLNCFVEDLEYLKFEKESFDGIWCHTSLIHLDNKEKITNVLEKFYQILKNNSVLFVALREGEGEQWELYNDIPNTKRWFLYFKEDEFNNYIPNQFILKDSIVTKFKNRKFLNYHLLK